jgi:hypothetical protein
VNRGSWVTTVAVGVVFGFLVTGSGFGNYTTIHQALLFRGWYLYAVLSAYEPGNPFRDRQQGAVRMTPARARGVQQTGWPDAVPGTVVTGAPMEPSAPSAMPGSSAPRTA